MSAQEDRLLLALLKDVNVRILKTIRARVTQGMPLTTEEIRTLAAANTALIQAIRTEMELRAREGGATTLSDLGLSDDDIETLARIAEELESTEPS